MTHPIARGLVTQALYDHDGGASGPGLIATRQAEAHARAEAALRALAEHGWLVLPVSTVSDMQDERDELLRELAIVTAQRDRLLEDRVAAYVVDGPTPWPLDVHTTVEEEPVDG